MSFSCESCGCELPDSYVESSVDGAEVSAEHTSTACPGCGAALPGSYIGPTVAYVPEPEEFHEGKQVSHFVLKERLGGGGFGEVWLAHDESLGRDVALKFPKSAEREAGNLMHEARTAASLKHPNIVAIHEVGRDQGRVFIASDYIPGSTLRDRMSPGRLSTAEVRKFLLPVIHALNHAHQQGVVHRDIKPGNILIGKDEQPWITDFGIAKVIQDDDTKSFDGQVVGTAKYMSPEQAEGKTSETDRRSDIYSLGVLLFEMLTGEVPFRGTMRAIINQKINEDAPSPRKLNAKLARDLETICLKCLERQPERRYQTAAELADELEREARGEPILARPVSQVERLWRWCKRRPLVAGLLAGLFVSLTAGLTGVTFFWREAEQNAGQLRESLYGSRMNLIEIQMSNGDIPGVQRALARVARDPLLDTVRGFEFGYYSGIVAPLRSVASHGDVVLDVAVTYDGDLCASIGSERRIRVFDVATGEEVRALSIDKGRFRSIAFSPSRGVLASACSDGLVRIWNPRQDARLLQQFSPGGQISRVRYSQNGRWLLTVGTKGPVRIFDSEEYKEVAALPSGPSYGRDARFLGDGSRVLVASNDGQLRLYAWTPEAHRIVQQFGPLPEIQGVAVSDDEQFVAAGAYTGSYAIWDLNTGTELHAQPTLWGRIDAVEFLPHSHTAAFAIFNGRTRFVDSQSGKEVLDMTTHGRMQAALVRTGNGKSFLYGNNDGTLLQLNLSELRMPSMFWHNSPIEAVAFFPDGRHLLAADYKKVISPEDRQVIQVSELRIWDLTTAEYEQLEDDDEPAVNCLAVSDPGKCFATGGIGSRVLIRETESRKVLAKIQVSKQGTLALTFSPLSGRLAIAPRQGPVMIYGPHAWDSPACTLDEHGAAVAAFQFSPDETHLAIAWDDGSVRLHDALSGQPTEAALHLESRPSSLQYCEGGELLAIGTDGGEIHLWDPRTKLVRHVIKAHLARVSALATLDDGKTLASGGRDRILSMWDTRSGEQVARLLGHNRQIYSLSISPDGETIASGAMEGLEDDQHGLIRLWHGDLP